MRNNPYIGPRPYERQDRHSFFGRARQARDLLALVKAERAVLFYAQSGAGKTSLLNTQIIPTLEEEGFHVLPVTRVGCDAPPDIKVKSVPNIFVFSALMVLAGRDVPVSSGTALSQDLRGIHTRTETCANTDANVNTNTCANTDANSKTMTHSE